MDTLGGRVKKLRGKLTQKELAALVPGMSASAISQLESGMSKGVKPENLIDLAKALGMTAEELVRGKDVKPRQRQPASILPADMIELNVGGRIVKIEDDRHQLLDLYDGLSKDRKQMVVAYVNALHDVEHPGKSKSAPYNDVPKGKVREKVQ